MSKIEFLVYKVHEDEIGTIIDGIVNKGVINSGIMFSTVRTADAKRLEIELSVTKIITYRREIGELSRGVSGGLHVAGTGAQLVHPDDVLEA